MKSIPRRGLLVFASLLAICIAIPNRCPGQTSANLAERSNVIVIMTDDQGFGDFGCNGNPVAQTPNIDRLASQSVQLTDFHVAPMCTPTRGQLLTGLDAFRNGAINVSSGRTLLRHDLKTMADVFAQAGYRTGVFGKWHLKSIPVGFDDYKVLQEQGRYQNPEFVEKGQGSLVEHAGWVDDVITEMTQQFITENSSADQPFFVMCHYKSAHDPWASRPPFDTAYQNMHIPEPENLCDDYEDRSEAAHRTTLKLEMMDQRTFAHQRLDTPDTCEQRKYIYQQYIKAYLRSAQVIDDSVGKLMQFLRDNSLADNTIVIYTSDQGHFLGEHGFFSKRFIYEEAMQMPLIVRYPGKVEAGSRRPELITNLDLAPTVLDLAGVTIPEDMQGVSFAELLKGNEIEDWRDAIYYRYWQHLLHRRVAAHYGIRTAEHKLIFYYGLPLGQTDFPPTEPEWEMFDLRKDPQEMRNVYDDPAYDQVVARLKEQLLELKKQYDDTDDQYPELQQVHEAHF